MTLKEMAAEYRTNIIPWRQRASILRRELAECTDRNRRSALEQQLRMAASICREGKELARIMETYYEERSEHDVPKTKSSPRPDLSEQ